jgi:phage terminase Nu1 subunit (DNA packaging protein)
VASSAQPIAVIAKLLDLSERRVQQLSREGVIPKATRGQYDLVGSVRGYVRYLRDQAAKAQAGAPDYASERARFIRARADLAEMEAAEKRGAVIPAADVEAAWIAVLARLRTRILALPDRLAPLVHAEASPAGVRDTLRGALREALEELAETDVRPERDHDDAG